MKIFITLHADGEVKRGDCPLGLKEMKKVLQHVLQGVEKDGQGKKGLEELGVTLPLSSKTQIGLGLLLCDDIVMRGYQKRFRKLDRTTDVLSFPTRELFKDKEAAEFAQRGHPISLGDLVISLPAVERGAQRAR